MIWQQIINGLALGTIYSLVAIGFSLIYSTMRLVNFAHGEFFMVASFIGLIATRDLGLPYTVTVLIVPIIMFLGGVLLERTILSPAAKRAEINVMITTIGLSLVLRDSALLIFGSAEQRYPGTLGEASFMMAGHSIPVISVIVAVVGLVAIVGLGWFLSKTPTGISMRATAQDELMSQLIGINTKRIRSLSFGLSAALGGLAGVLIAPGWLVSFGTGGLIGLKGFTAAVIGGYGNLTGAVIGGLVLGLAEQFMSGYISSTWRDALVFGLLLVVLLVRPTGLIAAFKTREA